MTGAVKTLEAYRRELEAALATPVSSEKAKKVLDGLGVAYSETPKWSLPLRLVDNQRGLYSLVDADEQLLFAFETFDQPGIPNLQIILSAANAELTRQGPAGSPLFHRQGDTE